MGRPIFRLYNVHIFTHYFCIVPPSQESLMTSTAGFTVTGPPSAENWNITSSSACTGFNLRHVDFISGAHARMYVQGSWFLHVKWYRLSIYLKDITTRKQNTWTTFKAERGELLNFQMYMICITFDLNNAYSLQCRALFIMYIVNITGP